MSRRRLPPPGLQLSNWWESCTNKRFSATRRYSLKRLNLFPVREFSQSFPTVCVGTSGKFVFRLLHQDTFKKPATKSSGRYPLQPFQPTCFGSSQDGRFQRPQKQSNKRLCGDFSSQAIPLLQGKLLMLVKIIISGTNMKSFISTEHNLGLTLKSKNLGDSILTMRGSFDFFFFEKIQKKLFTACLLRRLHSSFWNDHDDTAVMGLSLEPWTREELSCSISLTYLLV